MKTPIIVKDNSCDSASIQKKNALNGCSMLPENPLPQLIPNRIQAAVKRLQEAIWTNAQPLKIEATEAVPELIPWNQAVKRKRAPVATPSYWGRQYDQRWVKIAVPASKEARWLRWLDQGEATLYVDGEAFSGFDVAHRYCKLPASAKEVWIESLCLQTGVWHHEATGVSSHGSFCEGATLLTRDEEAWNAFHDLKCLLDVALDQRLRENPMAVSGSGGFGQQPVIDSYSPSFRRTLRLMDEAVDALDTEGISALRKKLRAAYEELRVDKTFMHCNLTGHAHLDLVWIWPERMGEIKASHIFATIDQLMEEYPEFRFSYSQPASYESVKRRNPELYKRVKKKIARGQWQATGAMYVESDTIFACGEALFRSFHLGQKGFVEINGAPSKLTWLPDVFGYSACMPQIMAQTGVKYFFTTKMTWNAINRFPHSSFIWRGSDGSEIVSHVTQDSGYVTHMEVSNIKMPMLAHQQGDVHHEYLLPTGYGDGGGGPTAEMCERARRLGSLPGMPSLSWEQPEAFFERLDKVANRLPVHQGECYLEYHRGTYTTHSNLKASFRGLERAMQVAESIAAATGKRWEMEHAWKRLVFAQFHDYIPGSSVWDVYLEGLPELDRLAAGQMEQARKALASSKKGKDCLFNPHAVPVTKWIEKAGAPVRVSLPALAGVELDSALVSTPDEEVQLKGKTVSNGLVTFRVDSSGWIDQVEWEGVSVPLSGPFGQLISYADRAANFEAWDIDRHVLSLGEVCKSKAKVEAFTEGAHRAGFRVSRAIGKKSEATVIFSLEAGSPLIHLSIDLNWQEPESLLKIHFPTRYAATNARYGAPFGSVLRPQVPNGLLAEAMWEVPFSRYLAVFDEGEREGLFVVSESKYGATTRSGEIGVSLVRSPRVTGFEGHKTGWNAALTRLEGLSICSDIGTQQIKLALGRYDTGLARERQPATLADTLFTEPVAYVGTAVPPVLASITGDESLVPAWVKPTEKGEWILRLHEVGGRRGEVRIHAREGWDLQTTDLSETASAPVGRGGKVRFEPYKIVSVRFVKT